MNPYAPPAAATRVIRPPFLRFRAFSYAATACGLSSAVIIGLATESALWGAAALLASLMFHFFQASTIAWLTERTETSTVEVTQ